MTDDTPAAKDARQAVPSDSAEDALPGIDACLSAEPALRALFEQLDHDSRRALERSLATIAPGESTAAFLAAAATVATTVAASALDIAAQRTGRPIAADAFADAARDAALWAQKRRAKAEER